MPRLGVLVSGRGSNLGAVITAIREQRLRAEVAIVVANVAHAGATVLARDAGLPVAVMPHRHWPTRAAYDEALASVLQERAVDVVCLAGFMRLLGAPLLDRFPQRVLNIHPSLLPSFPGLHAVQQALEHGVKVSGATVHLVDKELDAGPIVMQAAVPVLETDTVASLSARILEQEHVIYPAAIQRVLDGNWRVAGRRLLTP